MFDRYRYVLDAELQQRACEYYVIANRSTDDLLEVVCDEMPPFPERESALVGRLIKKQADGSDRRTWTVGSQAKKPWSGSEAATTANGEDPQSNTAADSLAGLDLSSAPKGKGDADLLGMNGQVVPSPEEITSGPSKQLGLPDSASGNQSRSNSGLAAPEYTQGSEKWFDRLAYSSEGVLFEDASIQVGIKSEYHGHLGRVALFFGNKLTAAFSSFTVTVESQEPAALQVTLPQIPASTLGGKMQVKQVLQIECKDFFEKLPILRFSYLAGSHQTFTLRLPVFICKFIEPVSFSQSDFFDRWKQMGGPPLEAQKIFPIRLDPQGAIENKRNKRVVTGFRLGVLEGIDPNPNNVVAAGVLHMSTAGKVGCLLRLEPNAQAKVRTSLNTAAGFCPGEL